MSHRRIVAAEWPAFAFLVLSLTSCASVPQDSSTPAITPVETTPSGKLERTAVSRSPEVIAGVELQLVDNGGTCAVGTLGTTIPLSIPWPCDFHREKGGSVRVEELQNRSIVLIEHSMPDTRLPIDCTTQLQAINLIGDELSPSEYTDSVAACPPFRWDRKVFTGLFE